MKYFRYICLAIPLWSPLLSMAGGQFNPAQSSIQLPNVLLISNGMANGSILWTSPEVISELSLVGSTPGGVETAQFFSNVHNGQSKNGDVYATGFDGIGVRWRARWKARNFMSGKTMSITTLYENNPGESGWRAGDKFPQSIWMELVKTGAVENGALTVKSSVETKFSCPECNSWTVNASGIARVRTIPACHVVVPDIRVQMRAVNLFNFTGLGSISKSASFSIKLKCSGGTDGTFVRPSVTLTDANDRNNRSSVLSVVSGKGYATGIGIQILKDDVALSYGPESSEAGTMNQWQAGVIAYGVSEYEIPLTARYVQIASEVTHGAANGKAIFTMSYQ